MQGSAEDTGKDARPNKDGNRRSTMLQVGLVLGSVAVVAGILVYRAGVRSARQPAPAGAWTGSVVQAWRAGGGTAGMLLCTRDGSNCQPASRQTQISPPALLRTDEWTRVQLRLVGTVELVLDRGTELVLPDANRRQLQLTRGSVVLNSKGDAALTLQVQVSGATLTVGSGKVAISADSKGGAIDVAHGVLKLVDNQRHEAALHAGEQARISDGRISTAGASTSLGEDIAWSENRSKVDDRVETSRGLGELAAKKPGANDELKGLVRLASHKVQVRIVSSLVRTEIEERFENGSDDILEGIYRFPLPADAKIERLALDVDGQMEEGAFVDRERAAAIWRGAIVNATPVQQRQHVDDIVWVPGPWRDPALLEWQRGGRFELRVYPIPKRGTRRVVLTYTQISTPSGALRRYTYPLAYDPSATTKIGQFDVDIQVRGHDVDYGVRCPGYQLKQASDGGVLRLSATEDNFVPRGDIILEYALPHRDAEIKAWAYTAKDTKPSATSISSSVPTVVKALEGTGYAAVALRPQWPRSETNVARDVVVVVDASRSMLGENFKRAQLLTQRVLSELEPSDRGSVLACDVACQVLPEGLITASSELTEAASKFLSSLRPEGASDPTAAVRAALVLADRGRADRAVAIVYVGDGTPTVGPVRPGTVEKAIEHDLGDAAADIIAVGIGNEADAETLNAMARGGGGLAINFLPGQGVDEVAYNVLSAIRGTHLRNVRVTLPEGLVDIAPRRPETLRSGAELWVTARMLRPTVRGDVVLMGRLGKASFERRWPVELVASPSDGNAFVPRLFAAARILDLERIGDAEAKREVIELSQLHHVVSRYTSLLVLESEAMLKAFHLKKSEPVDEWLGETKDEQQVQVAADSSAQAAGSFASTSKSEKAAVAGAPAPLTAAARKAPASAGRSAESGSAPAPTPTASGHCGCDPSDLPCNMRCAASGGSSTTAEASPAADEFGTEYAAPPKAQAPPVLAMPRSLEDRPGEDQVLRFPPRHRAIIEGDDWASSHLGPDATHLGAQGFILKRTRSP